MLRLEFNARLEEVNEYFNFLEKIESDYMVLTNYNNSETFSINDNLLKILKANGFLILYNLIEATILNSIVAIFDEIKIDNLSYSRVTDEIKKYWLKNKYKHSQEIKNESVIKKIYDIAGDIINNMTIEVIKEGVEYGGSIDALKIRKISESLGVSFTETHFKPHHHGEVLKKIRSHRNDLAHGSLSFSEIGKNISYQGSETNIGSEIQITSFGLKHYKQLTEEHLEKYIESVENFIISKSYKIS